MSDYTPTTKEVRDVYGYAKTFRDFDDWLEQHDKEVAQATEQRIIKLLDEFYSAEYRRLSVPHHTPQFNEAWAMLGGISSCIGLLVKGENK